MIVRLFVALWLVLAAFPAAAHAQDPQQRIDAARRRAESAGIPVALLDSKVAEGRAKGVPMDRIAGAVERRLGALSRAREAMAGAPRNAPVSSAAVSPAGHAVRSHGPLSIRWSGTCRPTLSFFLAVFCSGLRHGPVNADVSAW